MMRKKAYIMPTRCEGSSSCPVLLNCPQQAVSLGDGLAGRTMVVDKEKCIGCEKCISVCNNGACLMCKSFSSSC